MNSLKIEKNGLSNKDKKCLEMGWVQKVRGSSPATSLFQPKPYKVIDLYKISQT
jgi:hypothetical protein